MDKMDAGKAGGVLFSIRKRCRDREYFCKWIFKQIAVESDLCKQKTDQAVSISIPVVQRPGVECGAGGYDILSISAVC